MAGEAEGNRAVLKVAARAVARATNLLFLSKEATLAAAKAGVMGASAAPCKSMGIARERQLHAWHPGTRTQALGSSAARHRATQMSFSQRPCSSVPSVGRSRCSLSRAHSKRTPCRVRHRRICPSAGMRRHPHRGSSCDRLFSKNMHAKSYNEANVPKDTSTLRCSSRGDGDANFVGTVFGIQPFGRGRSHVLHLC